MKGKLVPDISCKARREKVLKDLSVITAAN